MMMLEEVLNKQGATATPATSATYKLGCVTSVAAVATVAVAGVPKLKIERANLRSAHAEQTGQETALYTARLQAFQSKGIADDDAETLANRLIERDRQLDDRRSCAECSGYYADRCKYHLSPIGESTIQTLHRCKGFTV